MLGFPLFDIHMTWLTGSAKDARHLLSERAYYLASPRPTTSWSHRLSSMYRARLPVPLRRAIVSPPSDVSEGVVIRRCKKTSPAQRALPKKQLDWSTSRKLVTPTDSPDEVSRAQSSVPAGPTEIQTLHNHNKLIFSGSSGNSRLRAYSLSTRTQHSAMPISYKWDVICAEPHTICQVKSRQRIE